MSSPRFFPAPKAMSLGALARQVQAELRLAPGVDETHELDGLAPVEDAGARDLSFIENTRYLKHLESTGAGAVLISPKHVARAPESVTLIVTPDPYGAFAVLSGVFYPDGIRLRGAFGGAPIPAGAIVDATAQLEEGVVVEPGAVIGPRAGIGAGSIISAGAVIGHDVQIGRNGHIGPQATVQHALLGNDVIVHAGARIGSDGFGFAPGMAGHRKIPQVGRVIIQDRVEIGANSCIDRGANRDTVVGEGTKIDNLVQIGHNVTIGRHCFICGNVGIAGSAILQDYVVLGGGVGINGHVTIGQGARIAGSSNVASSVPPGEDWAGTPARPARIALREVAALKRLAEGKAIRGKS